MNNKRTRYIINIFTLDRIGQNIDYCTWDDYYNFEALMEEYEKHYGLKLVSKDKEVLIIIEYANIIWNYKIYFGSYKKKYKPLTDKNDERWNELEKTLIDDLKMMGLEHLSNEILMSLKNKKYYEYHNKVEVQFKKYCISE